MAVELFGLKFGKDETEKYKAQDALGEDELFRVDTFVKDQPRVDALPSFVIKEYEAASAYKGVWALLALLMLLGAGSFLAVGFFSVSNQDKIDDLTAQNTSLQEQATALTPYNTYFLEVDAKREAIYNKFSVDVNYAEIFNGLRAPAAANSIEGMNYSAYPQTGQCYTEDPFTPTTDVGCITFNAETLRNWEAVHSFSDDLNATTGFSNVYFPVITLSDETDGKTTFEGYAGFTQEMFNNKFAPLSVPLFEMLTSDSELVFGQTTFNDGATDGTEATTDGTEAATDGTATEGEEN